RPPHPAPRLYPGRPPDRPHTRSRRRVPGPHGPFGTGGGGAGMSTTQNAFRDSRTMLRRNFKHARRYPSVSLLVVGIPVILLLLFVYVFGGALGAGLG